MFSYHCKFVSILSLSSSPMVYKFFFVSHICLFSCIGEGFSSASFSLLFRLSCFLLFSVSLHSLLYGIVNSFRVLFLLHHWFIYFFRFSYLFVFLYWRRSPLLHCLLFWFLLCRICSIVVVVTVVVALGYRVLYFYFLNKFNKNAAIYHRRIYECS